jgi:hypothetical protein
MHSESIQYRCCYTLKRFNGFHFNIHIRCWFNNGIFDLLDLSSFADALVIEADRKLASSEPYLVVMIERVATTFRWVVRYTRRSQFVVNLLRRSEFEEVR